MYAYRATLLQLASQPTRLACLEDILPRSADVDAEVENTSASSGFSALRAVAQRLHPHSSFVVSKYDKEGLDFCADTSLRHFLSRLPIRQHALPFQPGPGLRQPSQWGRRPPGPLLPSLPQRYRRRLSASPGEGRPRPPHGDRHPPQAVRHESSRVCHVPPRPLRRVVGGGHPLLPELATVPRAEHGRLVSRR